MPLATTASIVASAPDGACAFNIITLEHAEAVVVAAGREGLPVILQISENAVRFRLGRPHPFAAAARALAEAAPVPVALHLDHVTDDALLYEAAEAGFGSVMYDASRDPYETNLARTEAAARWAHENGLWLEAELGEVGGKDGAHAPGARTDPAEAAAFVATTGVDALAVAVGNSHAMTSRSARLDHNLIAALRAALPATVPLVLHGSSGVPDDELRRAVTAGLKKINIGTALNVAFTGALRDSFADGSSGADPRPRLEAAREAMAAETAHLLRVVSGRD
ncbi:class II fructose-bisphosphate aldolase [Streptosporangium sp. NPDC050855]|uniref:class II fructose-bisphosphate aldolase n=1 Tax=Streptosporangium sp. NPDC050855 TaxID=3366194 RepID=UPI0037BA80C3